MIPLLYRDRRHEGSTTLRQTQLVALHLLEVLKRVCEENGLKYWLSFGTLLGAVRNAEFIPWDDDVDVYMTLGDVKKLAKIADSVLPKDVIWQDWKTFPRLGEFHIARLRDAYSTVLESSGNCPRRTSDPQGVPLDIFILRPVRARWFLKLFQRVRGPLEWRYRLGREDGPVTVFSLIIIWLRGLAYYSVECCFRLRLIWPFGHQYFIQDYALASDAKLVFPSEWFNVRHECKFENGEYSVPVDSDACCRMMYGEDYMIPRKTKPNMDQVVYLPTTPCSNVRAMRWARTVHTAEEN